MNYNVNLIFLFRNRKKKSPSNKPFVLSETIQIKQERPDIPTINVQQENQNVQIQTNRIKQENQKSQNVNTKPYEYVNIEIFFFILNVCVLATRRVGK